MVHHTQEMKSRSDTIRFVSEGAVRFLGLKDYAPESLHKFMRASQVITSNTERGDEMEAGEDMDETDFFDEYHV